jgi:hypothetical protein
MHTIRTRSRGAGAGASLKENSTSMTAKAVVDKTFTVIDK